ncbi:MAG: HEAT repeat domain-containing protein [Deltaproteobacteria bacterium]|jgi:HEAT repeat protein|nr:HEAT repeat domain-containing protein [Deltaproteobacteria bacterium]MBT6435938.1 HEAT repeat domain-containing protein [Deltaproteobacteria bacterium]MBT6490092.1 HEAT repeat domain-containing protein [Deltaproteobacteria bacterium]
MTRKLLAVIAATFILASCSQPEDPTTSAYWIAQLENKEKRPEALTQLGKLGDKTALPSVQEWFEQEGSWTPEAAYALGRLGDATIIPALKGGISYTVGTGSDKKTRAKNRTNLNIAKAMGQLKAESGVDALIRLTTMPDLNTREAAMRAIGKIGSKTGTETLIKIARTETQPFLRKTAIMALGDLGDDKGIPVLIDSLYMELPGTSFYYEARHSLLQIGKSAIPALIETLERKNKAVEAIRLPSGVNIAEGAIEGKAAFVLGSLRAQDAEKQMLAALKTYYKKYQNRASGISASVPGAVAEIAYSLGNLGTEASIKSLSTIANETDANLRIAATEALTYIGATKSVASLLAAAKTGNAAARRAAIEAVAMLGAGSETASLDGLKGPKEEATQEIAKIVAANKPALAAATECKSDATCWTGKLADANIKVRRRAAFQLGWLGSKESIASLMKAVEDESSAVRMAAMASVSRLGGADLKVLNAALERWGKKVEYKNSNQELKRLIERSRNQG